MLMIWIAVLLICLVIEFVRMELYGAFGAIGALAGIIAYAFGLNQWVQIAIAAAAALILIIAVRPFFIKYINRMKKESRMQSLVGSDAVVICTIDNSQGVGVVNIAGRQWSARSHRANVIIKEGTVVKVVAVNRDTAIVDDRRRNYDSGS